MPRTQHPTLTCHKTLPYLLLTLYMKEILRGTSCTIVASFSFPLPGNSTLFYGCIIVI